MAITTAMCGSFKAELAMGAHRFGATVSPTGNLTSGSPNISSLSSMTGIIQGGAISGTAIPTGAVAKAVGTASVTMSANATANETAETITFTYDTFNVALIKFGMTGTYGASSTNYSNVTGNSDEASGTGYTAGGQALSANISPANSAGNAYWSWSTNPSWTNATVDVAGCMIYNIAANLAGVTGRAVSVHDFGGEQKVPAGTLTIIFPSNAASTSILQIN